MLPSRLSSRPHAALWKLRCQGRCYHQCISTGSFPGINDTTCSNSPFNICYKRFTSSGSTILATDPFQRLVQLLKTADKTCTIIESSCGGLISSSIMGVPGSSAVYFGGTVAYNTRKSGTLLCGDEELHNCLLNPDTMEDERDKLLLDEHPDLSEEAREYVRSKLHWTREAAKKYCHHVQTDFAIAEGGATGPTFRPTGLTTGFAVLAVASRTGDGKVEILKQHIVRSSHAKREENMRLFANCAAKLCTDALNAINPVAVEIPTASYTNTSLGSDVAEGMYLDRSTHLRGDDEMMEKFYRDTRAVHVIVRGLYEVLFASSRELAQPTLTSIVDDGRIGEEVLKNRTFLGLLGDSKIPVFAMFLPKDTTYGNNSNCYFATTRSHAPMLLPIHNELALTATAYVNWQETYRYCNICGSALEYIHGGTCAKCTNSNGSQHFHWPRQDPSIIVLVTNSDSTHALLARSPRHPLYLYTALAGFVEAGESFEAATCREVHEEVGVHLDSNSIEYISSQSWPFPRSCMIGMRACSIDGLSSIRIDPSEIIDAQWFDKEIVYQAARDSDSMGAVLDTSVVGEKQKKKEWTGKFLVPSKGVLARTLIDSWLESS